MARIQLHDVGLTFPDPLREPVRHCGKRNAFRIYPGNGGWSESAG
jgi:hypothetical protein